MPRAFARAGKLTQHGHRARLKCERFTAHVPRNLSASGGRPPRSFAFAPFALLPERQSLLRRDKAVRIGGRALDLLSARRTRGRRELLSASRTHPNAEHRGVASTLASASDIALSVPSALLPGSDAGGIGAAP